MTTLLFVFISALVISLLVTPIVRELAVRCNFVHIPSERCAHDKPLPHIGGIALSTSFYLALLLSFLFQTRVSMLLYDTRVVVLLISAFLIVILGLIDDILPLRPSIKFLAQIFIAGLTWYGGIQISLVSLSLSGGAELGWLSLPVTVFWVVFVTNAINLIDGLDGLAAGICFFGSIIMLLLCITSDKLLIALMFASLSGSLLGFLRYNFNPASIFMGDCGSYFLGYIFAALSILGSVKGQATAAMLIPFIILGVPLFDAIISPVRRFARGKDMFSPDQSHVHHRLLQKGYSQRKTVIILYTVTILLGTAAFTLTLIKDEKSALLLFVPFIALFIAFRKLGYLNYIAVDKVYGWFRDINEASRLSHGSRTFLDYQINIRTAESVDELWKRLKPVFEFLEVDSVHLQLRPTLYKHDTVYNWQSSQNALARNNPDEIPSDNSPPHIFRIEFPLILREHSTQNQIIQENVDLGLLIIGKDVGSTPIQQFTIRRIEQLQRETVAKLATLM